MAYTGSCLILWGFYPQLISPSHSWECFLFLNELFILLTICPGLILCCGTQEPGHFNRHLGDVLAGTQDSDLHLLLWSLDIHSIGQEWWDLSLEKSRSGWPPDQSDKTELWNEPLFPTPTPHPCEMDWLERRWQAVLMLMLFVLNADLLPSQITG